MDLRTIRREYRNGGLDRDNLSESPFTQFSQWMDDAIKLGLKDPTAMTLATVSDSGQPSQRIVLLKGFDASGFSFYTNLGSRKAKEIGVSGKVSIHFPWHDIERQVVVFGLATKISVAETLKYFASRPEGSKIAAWTSKQSHTVISRDFLVAQYKKMQEKFKNGEVPLPDFWGGYRITPHYFEFWQGRENRLARPVFVSTKWRCMDDRASRPVAGDNSPKRAIILIGMPGAGKSTLGVLIAKALARPFIDTDILLQTMLQMSLQRYLDQSDYMSLREREQEVILGLKPSCAVISTGGSAVYSSRGMAHLRNFGVTVFLDVPLERLLPRLGNLANRGVAAPRGISMADLYEERRPLYLRESDIRICLDDLPPHQAVEEVIQSVTPSIQAKK